MVIHIYGGSKRKFGYLGDILNCVVKEAIPTGQVKDGEMVKAVLVRARKEHKREIKIAESVNFETEINIYGNKIALLSFQRPYAGVIIEDIAIAQTHRSIWQLLWDNI